MDFFENFREIVIYNLEINNIKFDRSMDTNLLCIRLIESLDRLFIPQGKYKIEISKELQEKLNTYDSNTISTLNDIKQKLEEGISVSGYFSGMIYNSQKGDVLLKNWNIYHAHISKPISHNEKFSKRSGNLLFFTHKDNIVYFIDILPHPPKSDKYKSWFERSLLEIIHDNWIHLLNIMPMTDIKPDYTTDDEVRNAMDRGINSYVCVRDKIVSGANGGISSDKSNVNAVIKTDYIFEKLGCCEEILSNHEELKREYKKDFGTEIKEPINFELILKDGFFVAYDKQNEIFIKMFESI